jgi:acyl-coenzyme A synthetase/AMP-(fatty) acid ligase
MTNLFPELGKYPENVALVYPNTEVLNYRDLVYRADGVSRSVDSRCLVFLLCSNTVDSIAGYLGILRASAVPLLIEDSIHQTDLVPLLDLFQPKYVFLSSDTYLNLDRYRVKSVHGNYLLLSSNLEQDYVIAEELAQLITTSGSTGSPKFVRQSYTNISTNVAAISEYLQIDNNEKTITTMPMSYSYGLSIINTHLAQNASVILNKVSVFDKTFWSLLKECCATSFGGVPYFYKMLGKLDLRNIELPALRYMTQAGGTVNKDLLLEFLTICNDKQIKFISMYGQTEAAPRMAYLPWEDAFKKIGSIGKPISGGKFRIENALRRSVTDHDLLGELVYEGKNVSLGYAESCYDLCRTDENNGVLHTRDQAYCDSDGYYYIKGRLDRFIKVFGHRVNLDEIESCLTSAGYDVACKGAEDSIQIYSTQQRHRDELLKYITTRTRIHKSGFSVTMKEVIPRHGSGKVNYSALE